MDEDVGVGVGPGSVRQRGGNWCVAEVAADHAATVDIGVSAASIMGGVSSAMASLGTQTCAIQESAQVVL